MGTARSWPAGPGRHSHTAAPAPGAVEGRLGCAFPANLHLFVLLPAPASSFPVLFPPPALSPHLLGGTWRGPSHPPPSRCLIAMLPSPIPEGMLPSHGSGWASPCREAPLPSQHLTQIRFRWRRKRGRARPAPGEEKEDAGREGALSQAPGGNRGGKQGCTAGGGDGSRHLALPGTGWPPSHGAFPGRSVPSRTRASSFRLVTNINPYIWKLPFVPHKQFRPNISLAHPEKPK